MFIQVGLLQDRYFMLHKLREYNDPLNTTTPGIQRLVSTIASMFHIQNDPYKYNNPMNTKNHPYNVRVYNAMLCYATVALVLCYPTNTTTP